MRGMEWHKNTTHNIGLLFHSSKLCLPTYKYIRINYSLEILLNFYTLKFLENILIQTTKLKLWVAVKNSKKLNYNHTKIAKKIKHLVIYYWNKKLNIFQTYNHRSINY